MKIIARDLMTDHNIELNATLTTDHPASSYGQPVMVIDEWGDCMSHQNWVLAGCYIVEIDDDEKEDFAKWYGLIEQMAGG